MSAQSEGGTPDVGRVVKDAVKKAHGWVVFLGIVLIVLGVAAITIPAMFTLAVAVLLGWILVVAGVVRFVHSFHAMRFGGFLWKLLGAVLYVAAGVVLLIYPLEGILALTLVLAGFFFLKGLTEVFLAFRLRPAPRWGWVLVDGIIALALAGFIWSAWPADSFWVIGLVVGIDLVFGGWSVLMLASAARSTAES